MSAGSPRGTFFVAEEQDGPRGLILLPDQGMAYAMSSLPSGELLLEEKDLTEVMCIDFARPAGEAPPAESDLPNVDPPPIRESRPGVTAVVYLDMDGEQVTSSSWNGGELITAASPQFSDSKAIAVWERVSEDFRPFQINVTTDLQVYLDAPENRRIRCIITPTGSWYGSAGGVAYVGSFNWRGDTPCWVFTTGEKSSAEAASHEVGHTLGLGHDGQDPDTEYYGGHGSGPTGWAPIMGVGYSRNLVQWSKGEYLDANRTQDDLQIITSQNGFTYRADDHGNQRLAATPLSVTDTGAVQAGGVVEQRSDVDAFIFKSRGGPTAIHVEPFTRSPNLDVRAELFDESHALVASANPVDDVDADLSINLSPGLYVLHISGTGKGDPLGTGYSDYASLGEYTISGTIAAAFPDQHFTVPENAPAPRTIGIITAVANPDGDPLVYTILNGNLNQAFAVGSNGVLTLSDGSLLDHERYPAFDLLLRVDNTRHPEAQTNLYVRVDVADVNEPPVLAQSEFLIDLVENPPAGAWVGAVRAEDTEGPVTYAVASGNEAGGLVLDPDSGQLRVADPAVLFANTNPRLDLAIVASDTGTPSLTATASVHVTIWRELVPENSPVRVRVPTGGSEDTVWRQIGFVDSHWTEGLTGVGYDRETAYDPLLGADVEAGMYSRNRTVYIRLPFTALDPTAYSHLRLRMKYDDGFVAYINNLEAVRRNAPGALTWNAGASSDHPDAAAQVYETIDISAVRSRLLPGNNLLAIHGLNTSLTSSDALFLPVVQATFAAATGVAPPVITSQTATHVTDATATLTAKFRAGGEAPSVHLVWGENDGGTNDAAWEQTVDLGIQSASATHALTGLASSTRYYFRFHATHSAGAGWADTSGSFITPEPPVTLVRPSLVGRVMVPTNDAAGTLWHQIAFDDSAWPRKRIGIGYERSSGYQGLFYSDLESDMYGVNETAYARASFQLSQAPHLQSLTLLMKYDDAFVAYLNGQEVARSANAPTVLSWNAGADSAHDDADAVEAAPFDLTAHIHLLQVGTNVLAIHGLNRNTTSSDFLVAPTLVATPSPILPWTYGRWIAQFQLQGAEAAAETDADGDGWDNALEYVLGGDPTQPDASAIAPTIRRFGNQIEYTYTRRIDPVALGLMYQVESSMDLSIQTWDPITGELVVPPVLRPDGITEQVTYRFIFPHSAVYLRLQVELPASP